MIFHVPDDFTNSMMYVPDSALVQEEEGESRKNSVSIDAERPAAPTTLSHLSITTKKVTDIKIMRYFVCPFLCSVFIVVSSAPRDLFMVALRPRGGIGRLLV